jgi:nitrate reductase (NAD(P)H)
MDPTRNVILAYMQNGEPLAPDHGFPVRLVVPGFIGGRIVKWFKRIVVACSESESYYHYRDNRLLPSNFDAELANAESRLYVPCLATCSCNLTVFVWTMARSFASSLPATSLDLPCRIALPWLRRRFRPVPPLPVVVLCRFQFPLCSSGLPKPRM